MLTKQSVSLRQIVLLENPLTYTVNFCIAAIAIKSIVIRLSLPTPTLGYNLSTADMATRDHLRSIRLSSPLCGKVKCTHQVQLERQERWTKGQYTLFQRWYGGPYIIFRLGKESLLSQQAVPNVCGQPSPGLGLPTLENFHYFQSGNQTPTPWYPYLGIPACYYAHHAAWRSPCLGLLVLGVRAVPPWLATH